MHAHTVVTIKALDGDSVLTLQPHGQRLGDLKARFVGQCHGGVLHQGQIERLAVVKLEHPFFTLKGNRRFRLGATQNATGTQQRPLLRLQHPNARLDDLDRLIEVTGILQAW